MKEKRQFVKLPLSLKIQFFAEGEGDVYRGGYNPDEEINFNPSQTNPLADDEPPAQPEGQQPEGQQPEGQQVEGQYEFDFNQEPQQPEGQQPQGEPNQQPEQIPTFNFGGREVQANDVEALEGAYEDFRKSQQYIQQLIQQNQQFQQQLQQQQQPQEPQVDIEKLNEETLAELYENPYQFAEKLTQRAVEKARQEYEPIIRQQRIESEVQQLSAKYNDFLDYRGEMQELVQDLGQERVEQLGLERVYHMAKGISATKQPATPAPTPEQLAQDPQFLQNYVMNNPQIVNQIMQQQMQNKQTQRPPHLMGNQAGGTQPLVQESRPKSLSEATKMVRKSWGI